MSAMSATKPPRPLALLLGGLLTTALVLAAALSCLTWSVSHMASDMA